MKTQEKPNPDHAIVLEIDENSQDQRIDNFLVKVCKGVPKAHLFRIIRSGEVRVNSKRVEAKHKLAMGDKVRVPPIKTNLDQTLASNSSAEGQSVQRFNRAGEDIPVLFEDDHLLVVNKPSGTAVHGGSGVSLGIIEQMRLLARYSSYQLELVHRIDRETSGVLIIAKKRSVLRALQEQLRNRSWKKYYQTLVLGQWPKTLARVELSLSKVQAGENEKKVFVDPAGDKAITLFKPIQRFKSPNSDFTLLQAQILTGRTHQIRVHTSASGYPIAGDDRYGDFAINKNLARSGLKRMFLHAARIQLVHPATNETIVLEAPLAPELERFMKSLDKVENQ